MAGSRPLVFAQLQPKLTPEQEAARRKAEEQKKTQPAIVQPPAPAKSIVQPPAKSITQPPARGAGAVPIPSTPSTVTRTVPPQGSPDGARRQTNTPTTPPPVTSRVVTPPPPPTVPSVLRGGPKGAPPVTTSQPPVTIQNASPVQIQQQPVVAPTTPSILREGTRRTQQVQQPVQQPVIAPSRPGVVVPLAVGAAGAVGAAIAIKQFSDVQRNRTERVEGSGGGRRTVIQEPDNRTIIRQDNRIIIRHDESARFRGVATDVRSRRRPDGFSETTYIRSGGTAVITVVDKDNRLVRRYRRDERGREVNLIDNRRFYRNAALIGVGALAIGVALNLRSPEVRIPREKYIVDYARASDDDLYEALEAPPIERLERSYSLDEIRYSYPLRERVRRIDLDTITFDFGAWEVAPEQFDKLERVARIMKRVLDRNPENVFLIEGHTDGVGNETDNLSLSDRRAESVADVLSRAFDIPPENLVTQGYGEQHLKVPTREAERLNRRVTVLNITQLMAQR